MWTEIKQLRFDDLWRRRFESRLTKTEEQELADLLGELDREEEMRLRPTMEQLDSIIETGRKELAEIERQNTILETIIAKREALLLRVKSELAQFQSESLALKAEYESVKTKLYSQAST